MYRYIEYLPGYLQEVQEYKALGEAADPLAEEEFAYIRQQYHNQLIETADERTIERWEAVLRLPYSGYDLPTRRQRILLRWQSRLAITEKKLKEILEGLTGAECRIILDRPRYSMAIKIYEHDFSRVNLELIRAEVYRLKPANLTMEIAVIAQTEVSIPLWAAVIPSLMRRYELTPQLPVCSPDATVPLWAGAALYINKSYEIEVK